MSHPRFAIPVRRMQPRGHSNPVALAMVSARKLDAAQQATLVEPPRAAVKALQFGQFTEHHWRNLADVFNIAEVLARPPVNLANDHAEKFQEAQCVLFALSEQHRDEKTWTPRRPQLDAIEDALEIFEIQLQYVGQGEFDRAIQTVVRRVSQAVAGNGNANVVTVEAIQ